MNILLNLDNFHEDFINFYLKKYIDKSKKVLIVPFSFHEDYISTIEDWNKEFGHEKGEGYFNLTTPFFKYGIPKKNIKFLNYFLDNRDTAKNKIANTDIIYFQGGYPYKLMERLKEFNIIDDIKNFKGIIMGASAGALVQFKEYHLTPESDIENYGFYEGLGFIDDFEIEVHYLNTPEQRNSMRRYFSDRKKKIYALGNEGAIVIDSGNILTFGDVMLYKNTRDLENIKITENNSFFIRDLNYDDINRIWEYENEARDNINKLFFNDIYQLENFVKNSNNNEYNFGIIEKENNIFIGFIHMEENLFETMKLNIDIFSPFESRENYLDIGGLVIDYIFREYNIRRIEVVVNYLDDILNDVLYNLGFKQEALFKNKVYKIDNYYDEIIFTIFKDDYYNIEEEIFKEYSFDEFYSALNKGYSVGLKYLNNEYMIYWDMEGNLIFKDLNSGNIFVYREFRDMMSSVQIDNYNLFDLIDGKLLESMDMFL